MLVLAIILLMAAASLATLAFVSPEKQKADVSLSDRLS